MPSNHLILYRPLLFLPHSFPASGSFSVSWCLASGGQSFEASASASVLLMNIQDWFPLGWTGWISLQSEGLSSLLQHHSSKASVHWCSDFFIVQLSHPYMTTGKTIALTRQTFVSKVMSLLFNMLSRLVITFLPRSLQWDLNSWQMQQALLLPPVPSRWPPAPFYPHAHSASPLVPAQNRRKAKVKSETVNRSVISDSLWHRGL